MGVGFDADAVDAGAAFVVADVFPGELQLLKGDVEHLFGVFPPGRFTASSMAMVPSSSGLLKWNLKPFGYR